MTVVGSPNNWTGINTEGVDSSQLERARNTPLNRATLRARGELDPSPNFRLYSFQAK